MGQGANGLGDSPTEIIESADPDVVDAIVRRACHAVAVSCIEGDGLIETWVRIAEMCGHPDPERVARDTWDQLSGLTWSRSDGE